MFENQPKGLWTLALANTGERFGYYTMLAVFALFLGENFGFDAGTASEIYTWFLTAVYFLPLFGGMAVCMERAVRTFLGNYFFTLMDALAR